MARLQLTIEVDGEQSPIASVGGPLHVRGTLRPEGGDEVGFVGWVSLLALLEQAVSLPAAS